MDDGRYAAQCRGAVLRRAKAYENDFFSVAFRKKAGGRVQIALRLSVTLTGIGRQSPLRPWQLAQPFVADD